MATTFREVKGWGEDAEQSARPGVPAEFDPPHPVGGAHRMKPEQEPLAHDVLKHRGRKSFAPVFGSGPGLKGLSGRIRRLAYEGIPDHRPSKWLLLLLSDRVDVLEQRLAKLPPIAPYVAAGSLAGLLTWRLWKRAS